MSVHRVERVLGNLADFPVGARVVERVAIESGAMARRLLRLPTSRGDLGVLFGDDTRLRDGDVLFADDARVIAVAVLPDDVLVVRPASIGEAAELGHALGNRHLPIIRDGDTLVVAHSDALENLLRKMGLRYERSARVLERPFVHAHAPHEHEPVALIRNSSRESGLHTRP
jgi:urease accessory protein